MTAMYWMRKSLQCDTTTNEYVPTRNCKRSIGYRVAFCRASSVSASNVQKAILIFTNAREFKYTELFVKIKLILNVD